MTKQNSFTKKVFAVLLSMTMVLTMMPVAAFAADDIAVQADTVTAGGETSTVGNAVAEVTASDGTSLGQYTSLNDAITAAQDSEGSTVTLLADTEVTGSYYNITKGKFTVDLNQRTVSTALKHCFYINDKSVEITIKNGTLAGTGTDNTDVFIVFWGAKATLENVTATAKGDYPVCVMNGTVTITGGECGTAEKKNGIYVDEVATVKLYGGIYHAIWTYYGSPFDYSTLLPEGYVFMQWENGSNDYTKYIDPSTMGTDSEDKQPNVYNIQVTKCTHSGGTDDNGNCKRCGLSHEHFLGSDGNCVGCGEKIVAQIDSTYYTDLATAFLNAADGDTVTLLTDVTESVTFDRSSTTVTLNMDGHSLTAASGAALTVSDGTLKFEGPVKINGGLLVTDGALEGGLPLDSVFTKGSNSYSIRWSKSEGATDVFNLRAAKNHAFAAYDSSTGTKGNIIEAGTTSGLLDDYARQIQMDVRIVPCDHSIGFNSGYAGVFCKGCMSPCPHQSVDDQNKCTECKVDMVAKGSSGYYYSLADDAFLNAADGDTVTLLASVKLSKSLFMNADNSLADKSVTLVMNGKTIYSENNANGLAALAVNSGRLTISDAASFSIPVSYDSDPAPAVLVDGGTLELETKATILGGLKVTKGSGGKDGTLEGGLKESTAITANGTGNNCYSVSVEGSSKYTSVLELLGEGLAFAAYDTGNSSVGDIVNGNVAKLTQDVIVVEHKTHDYTDGVCDCGFTCAHSSFTGGKCDVCGYECTHPSATEVDGKYTCDVCKEQMAVKVEKDSGETTYYTERHNSVNDETLWWLFNNNLESGSTVTLLADNLCAWAYVTGGKTITLDLNGKTLDETSQGITVGRNDDTETTNNKLIVKGTFGDGEAATDGNYAFRTWVGGELNLKEVADGGKIGSIIADGGKVTTEGSTNDIKIGTLDINNGSTDISFRAGTFDKITGNNTKTLGDLLANENPIQKSGKAFKYTTDGKAFVPYDTTITGNNPVTNVTIVDCPHDNITSGTTPDGIICGYCGMDNIAAVLTKTDGGVKTYTINSGTGEIFGGLKNDGGTLKLYRDLTCNETLGTQGGTTEMVIDLNGHTISLPTGATGQEVTLNGGSLTITDSGSGKGGRFAATLRVYNTASLTVDGVKMGTIGLKSETASITLKEGTTFTGYEKPDGLMLAQWIEDGDCISGGGNSFYLYDTADNNGSGSFAVEKAPAAFSTPVKSGTIQYNALMPEEVIPGITLDAGSSVSSVEMRWYYSKNGSFDMVNQNGTIYPNDPEKTWRGYVNSDSVFNKFGIGDTISDAFCVLIASDNSWSTVLRGYSFTLAAGDLSEATVTPTNLDSLVYTPDGNGSSVSQQLQFTVTHNNDWTNLTEGTHYQVKAGSGTAYTAGEHTLVLEGLGKYAGSTLEYEWNIAKRELTGMTEISKSYDGTTDLPDTIAFTYGENETVKLEKGDDYTVTGGYDSAGAGGRKVTATVKLTNPNYTFADGKIQQTFTIDNVSIQKAAAPTLTPVDITQKYTVTETKTADASKAGMPQDAGTLFYEKGTDAAITKVQNWEVNSKTGVVTYTLTGGAVGDKITLPVKISSTNYEDATADIVITLTDKNVPTVTAEDLTVTYDGNPVPADKITGTATFDGQTVKGTWSWKTGQEITNVAHSGEKTVVFTPEDTETYAVVGQNIRLTINKATPTGTPKYTAITKDGQTLADASLTAVDESNTSLFRALGKALNGILKWVQSDDKTTALDENTKVEQGKAYIWLFTPDDGDNYNTLSGTITPWRNSSGGGGAAIPSPSPANPDVITVKDDNTGSETGESDTTTKTTVKDTKTENTKNEQGQTVSKTTASVSRETAEELVKQATEHKSDTVEITVKAGTTNPSDGTGGETTADSVKSTELEIPKTTIEDIAKNTEADLVIKTDSGEVTLDNKTLETIAKEAKGDTVTITVNENTQLTEAQQPAKEILGKNGKLFDLAAKIGDKLIHHFDGGKAHVTLPMPDSLKGKDILVIYINDKGLCEILSHAVETVGADSYIEFTTPHFSTFAVVDRAEAENLIKAQNEARVKELMKNAKFKVTTTKTSKKSVKVTVTPKSNQTLISDIKSMGYTVKYQFYRSTKKSSGYKLLKTKDTSSYTNTKGTKGRKYYYKARVLVYDGKTLIAKSALKQASYGARTWTK